MEHPSPNDRFVRGMFKHAEVANDFFASIVRSALGGLQPQEVKLEPGSYVDEELASSYSDLLYSCLLGETGTLVYFLIEHQRKVYPMMPVRINRYCLAALEDWVKSHPGQRTVPPIVAMVLYQGERAWNAPTELKDLYALTPELKEAIGNKLPSGGFILIDLKELDLKQLHCGLLLRLTLGLMKAVIEGRQAEWLQTQGEDLLSMLTRADGRSIFRLMAKYIAATRKPSTDLSTFKELAFTVSNEQLRSELMTLAEATKEEGRQEGRQEGRLIGQIQLCEKFLGKPQRAAEQLALLTVAELEDELRLLEEQVKSRWNPN
jgi:predicted transposase YdaD